MLSKPGREELRKREILIRTFLRWAESQTFSSVPNVRGASNSELDRLAALGGIAARLAGDDVDRWPNDVAEWARVSPKPPQHLTSLVRALSSDEQDPLGLLYNASISSKNRRYLGTVFTPPWMVSHMIAEVCAELGGDEPALVVDPGAGVGAFSIEASKKWPSSRVMAVDVNPVTLGLLGARLAISAKDGTLSTTEAEAVELVLGDYFELIPGLLQDDGTGPKVVLGNPPYTRHQELSDEMRRHAMASSSGIVDSGQANLAIHFQGATLKHLGAEDVSCLVLPGSTSEIRAAAGLRRSVRSMSRNVKYQLVPPNFEIFRGHSVQASVLVVGSQRKQVGDVRIQSLALEPTGPAVDREVRIGRVGPSPRAWKPEPKVSAVVGGTLLEEIAKVRRGTATGASEVFFIDDEKAIDFPARVLKPAVRTLNGFEGAVLDAESLDALGTHSGSRWIVAVPEQFEVEGALAEYFSEHEDRVSERYLPSQRSPWYRISDLPVPQVLVAALAGARFAVARNLASAVPSNNIIGIDLKRGSPDSFVRWLISDEGQDELKRVSKRMPGGSYKLEPGSIRRLLVPESAL